MPGSDRGKPVDLYQMAVSNMISIEALMKVLVERGLVSKDELLAAVSAVQEEMVGNVRAGNVEQ